MEGGVNKLLNTDINWHKATRLLESADDQVMRMGSSSNQKYLLLHHYLSTILSSNMYVYPAR